MRALFVFNQDGIGVWKELIHPENLDARLKLIDEDHTTHKYIVLGADMFNAYDDIADYYLDDEGQIEQRAIITFSAPRQRLWSQPSIPWVKVDSAQGAKPWGPRMIVQTDDVLLMTNNVPYRAELGGLTSDECPITGDMQPQYAWEMMPPAIFKAVKTDKNPTERRQLWAIYDVDEEFGVDDFKGFKYVSTVRGISNGNPPFLPQADGALYEDRDYVTVTHSVDGMIKVVVGGSEEIVPKQFRIFRNSPGQFTVYAHDKKYKSDPMIFSAETPRIPSQESA